MQFNCNCNAISWDSKYECYSYVLEARSTKIPMKCNHCSEICQSKPVARFFPNDILIYLNKLTIRKLELDSRKKERKNEKQGPEMVFLNVVCLLCCLLLCGRGWCTPFCDHFCSSGRQICQTQLPSSHFPMTSSVESRQTIYLWAEAKRGKASACLCWPACRSHSPHNTAHHTTPHTQLISLKPGYHTLLCSPVDFYEGDLSRECCSNNTTTDRQTSMILGL